MSFDKKIIIYFLVQLLIVVMLSFFIGWVVGEFQTLKWLKESLSGGQKGCSQEILFERGVIYQDTAILPIMAHFEPSIETIRVEASAYTSDPAETDDTPNITASGEETRPGIIANNCWPIGTIISIDGVFYEVQDRMSKVYGCENIDIWMAGKEEALEFGRREIVIQKY